MEVYQVHEQVILALCIQVTYSTLEYIVDQICNNYILPAID